jgi:hypothetical protein
MSVLEGNGRSGHFNSGKIILGGLYLEATDEGRWKG